MWKVCNKNKIEKGGVANGTWSKDKAIASAYTLRRCFT